MAESMEDKLKQMIVERLFLKIEPAAIENDRSLIDDYGVDSVSLLELVVGLEELFDLLIEDEEFSVSNFETVTALAAFVRQKMSEAG